MSLPLNPKTEFHVPLNLWNTSEVVTLFSADNSAVLWNVGYSQAEGISWTGNSTDPSCHLLSPPVPVESECVHVLEQIRTVSPAPCSSKFSVFRFLQEKNSIMNHGYSTHWVCCWCESLWVSPKDKPQPQPWDQQQIEESAQLGSTSHVASRDTSILQVATQTLQTVVAFLVWINRGDPVLVLSLQVHQQREKSASHISSKLLTLYR